ncbi:MAG: MerR family DNA-binding transcriptional regulator [Dehalococcoidia bacterium]|nr:MerR family DNA-binding transcriptional regulator [Dehalococcoidia bacterium]
MKVSELARRAGVAASAVRFYEADGVLPPSRRTPAGDRDYAEVDLCASAWWSRSARWGSTSTRQGG